MSLFEKVNQEASKLRQSPLYRKRVLLNQGLQFSSNDYLSLTLEKRIQDAYQTGFKKYASGSGGSPLVAGYHKAHQSLEKAFADFLSVEDCLLFSSGYSANLALTRFLGSINAYCLIDKSIHASIYDGLTLSQVSYERYLHVDLKDFGRKVRDLPENSVVLTESIFSMSGLDADLSKMNQTCVCENQVLLVDEAHAIGVLGEGGRGAIDFHGLSSRDIPLRVIPLGKAFAGHGAIIAGLGTWIDALLQVARSYIYSTSMSPALAYGLQKTLEFVESADDRRQKLKALVNYFNEEKANSAFEWSTSTSAIQQLRLGSVNKAMLLELKLKEEGIIAIPMRAPTVTPQQTGLRIILNYAHKLEDIKRLFILLKSMENELIPH